MHARSAIYLDQILRGARPESLPVQQAEDFEAVLNARAARALGLAIPPMVLAVMDEVIE